MQYHFPSTRCTRCSTAKRTSRRIWTTSSEERSPSCCWRCCLGCWLWPSSPAATSAWRLRFWPSSCRWWSCSSTATSATGTTRARWSSGTRWSWSDITWASSAPCWSWRPTVEPPRLSQTTFTDRGVCAGWDCRPLRCSSALYSKLPRLGDLSGFKHSQLRLMDVRSVDCLCLSDGNFAVTRKRKKNKSFLFLQINNLFRFLFTFFVCVMLWNMTLSTVLQVYGENIFHSQKKS